MTDELLPNPQKCHPSMCQGAHGMPEESKVRWCKYAVNGTCGKGEARCNFPHMAVAKLNKLYRSVGLYLFSLSSSI